MNATLTYLYCLVRSTRRPVLRNLPEGVPGSTDLRLLDAGGGLWLVVATVSEAEYGEPALARGLQDLDWVGRRAMAHEAVVEHFLQAPAMLPMQMFTLFISEARAIAHVAKERRRIDRLMARVGGHLEWGLRLTWDEGAARAVAEAAPAAPRAITSGSAYLARKRDMIGAGRAQLARAKVEAGRVYRAMARHASQARRRAEIEKAAPGSRLLLDAAFLVPAKRAAAFRTALRQATRTLDGTGVVASLTGPWPPYNFIASS